MTYEVAPANLPPLTSAQFHQDYPDAVIKEVIATHVEGGGKIANIRIKIGDSDSTWVTEDWLDNEDPA